MDFRKHGVLPFGIHFVRDHVTLDSLRFREVHL